MKKFLLIVSLCVATTVVWAMSFSTVWPLGNQGLSKKENGTIPFETHCKVPVISDQSEADRLFEAGQFDAALPLYDSLIAENAANDPMVYFRRAMIYFNKGKWQAMEKDLSRAIVLRSDFADAYFYRAKALERQLRWQQSISDLEKAVAIDSHNFEYLYQLAIKKYSCINQYIDSKKGANESIRISEIRNKFPFAIDAAKDFEKLASMNQDYSETALIYANFFKQLENGILPH